VILFSTSKFKINFSASSETLVLVYDQNTGLEGYCFSTDGELRSGITVHRQKMISGPST
jgi:hypothetical protein